MPISRAAALRLTLALCLSSALTGCATESAQDPTPDPTPSVADQEYMPGRAVSVDLPDGDPTAVLVIVPGGGWQTADPAGLQPLADAFVDDGLAVVTITYGTSSTGDSYPGPVDDVRCAVAYAAATVPGVPVVLLGHSAGAQLAALAALRPDLQEETCPSPAMSADGVVGVAGPYDVSSTNGGAQRLFGVPESKDPEMWTEGNPLTWAAERPTLPVLLVHGAGDPVVAMTFTEDFADALTAGGHDVRVDVVEGADHATVLDAETLVPAVTDWIQSST
jgi:acetyl esterase/lipase